MKTINVIYLIYCLLFFTIVNSNNEHSKLKNLKKNKYICFCIGCQFASVGTCCQTDCSDIRLKEEIQLISKLSNGLNIYRWKWNKQAEEIFGKKGYAEGVIAQEVQLVKPEAISEKHGYLLVDYNLVYS